MARSGTDQGKTRFVPAALIAAGLALTIPAAGLAEVQADGAEALPETVSYLPFTPANSDPRLAARVAALIGEDGLRFTPANKSGLAKDRTVTVAVAISSGDALSLRSLWMSSVRAATSVSSYENSNNDFLVGSSARLVPAGRRRRF